MQTKPKVKDLIFNVKEEYFNQIKNGTKDKRDDIMVEFRLFNDYWRKRLEDKTFSGIQIRLGYPKG